MAGQGNIVLRHPVWHDICGGCHSSLTPSGLVALSRESIRGVNLLNVYFKMTCKSVRWRNRTIHLFQRQDRKGLSDTFRRLSLQKSIDNGVEGTRVRATQ